MVIHPDDRVVVRIARSEMGQGTYTVGAAGGRRARRRLEQGQLRVRLAQRTHPQEAHLGLMSTGGSQGVRSLQDYVRKAGAAARIMLVEAFGAEQGFLLLQ